METRQEIRVINEVELKAQHERANYTALLRRMCEAEPRIASILTESPERRKRVACSIRSSAANYVKCKILCFRDGSKLYVAIRENS